MSDPSSDAFFSRVNEDEIQSRNRRIEVLQKENAALKDQTSLYASEVERLKRVLTHIKDNALSDVITDMAHESLSRSSRECGDVLTRFRADLLEEQATKFSKATPTMSQKYQNPEAGFNPDLQEGYESALEDSVEFLMREVKAFRALVGQ